MLCKLLIYAAILSLNPGLYVLAKRIETDSSGVWLKPTTYLVPCEEGWVHFREKCYKIGGRELQDRVSWDEAADNCTMLGGHLVTIQSKEELDFVVSFLVLDIKLSVWIGLNDQVNESEYHWHDDSPVNFTNWEEYAPSGFGVLDYQDCVEAVFAPYRDAIGEWNDIACDRKNPYICQKRKEMRVQTPNTLLCDSSESGGWRFQESCYHLVTQPKTWYRAEEYCRKKFNGHMVTILDVMTDYFLNHISSRSKEDFWIGIKIKDQFQQKWTSGWHVAYDAKIFANQGEFYDGFCVLRSRHKEWTRAQCSNTYPFICETSTVLPPILKPAISESRCPTNFYDWRDLGGEFCYYVPRLTSENQTLHKLYANWHQANSSCKERGGDLVSIHSKEESDTLFPFIRFHPTFIGLFRISENEKYFAWSDGSDFDFKNWDINEPSNNHKKCVLVNSFTFLSGDVVEWKNESRWYDVDCERGGLYICSIRKYSFNSNSTETSKKSGKMSVKTLIATIVFTVLVIILIGVIIFCYFRPCDPKRQKRHLARQEPPTNSEDCARYRTQTENNLVENDLYESMSVTPRVLVK